MKPQFVTNCAFVITCTFVSAVSAQDWDRARAVAEITELTTQRLPRDQWPGRDAKMMAWLRRVEKTKLDLGDHAFTKAIPHFFNHDYKRAGEELFQSLLKQPKLPTDKFDACVGRILMLYARDTITDGALDLTRKVVPLALDFYSDRRLVYRVVAGTLKREPSQAKTSYLNELLAGMLSDKQLTAGDKQDLLAGLYGGGRNRGTPRRRAAGGRRAAPAAARARAKTIKPFEAKSIDGREIKLQDLAGKVVLVDFWATWCGPCIRKMPAIVSAHKEFKDRGFVVIGVSLDKEPGQKRGGKLIKPAPDSEIVKKIRATMKKLGMDWPVVYEGGGWETRLARENGIRAIPATFLIDRKGKVRYSNLKDDLAQRIRELLGERRL